MVMEERIRLDGDVAIITMKMTYSGPEQVSWHQELPALFVTRDLSQLKYVEYGDASPSLHTPPQHGVEHAIYFGVDPKANWVSYVDGNDQAGIAMYQKDFTVMTAYYSNGGRGDTRPTSMSCSYVAPLKVFALKPGMVVEYTTFLTLGTSTELKTRMEKLQLQYPAPPPPSDFDCDCYISNNGDLEQAFGHDCGRLLFHYENHGRVEKRKATC